MHSQAVQDSFLQIIENNKGIIYKIANAYCKNNDDRKDLVQEMIIQLWQSFSKYNGQYKFSTWMYRIALNTAISFYRKDIRYKKFSHPFTEEFISIKEENFSHEKEQNLSRLQNFINELPELDRALMLLYLEEKPQKEIAEILGLSETNISTKVVRIKNKLKQKFSTIQSL